MSFYYNGYVGPERRVIFHPHIPRTGGRFIEQIFKYNNFSPHFNYYDQKVNDVSLPHMDSEMYNNFYDEESLSLPSFTVIRNPIDRFISAYKVTRDIHSLPEINVFIKNLSYFYQSNPKSLDNFLTPQYKFLKKGMKLWKFENGFEQTLCDWININFDVKLKYDDGIKEIYEDLQKEKLVYENSCTLRERLSNYSKVILIKFYWRDFFIHSK